MSDRKRAIHQEHPNFHHIHHYLLLFLSKTIFLPQTTVYTKPIKKKCLNKKFNHSFCLIILGTINKLLLLLIIVVAFKYEITLM